MDLEPITLQGEPRESALGRAVVAESDVNVNLCYQCRKCAAGCPMAAHMDLTPTQVIHAVRLGQRDMVLKSKTIWLCISCETCTTRCPQGVDVARVMDAARIAAIREGVEPAIPEVAVFHKKAMKNIGRHGRMYELGLIVGLKLASGGITKDMALGVQLFKKGKLRLLPAFGKSAPMRRILKRAGEKKGEGA